MTINVATLVKQFRKTLKNILSKKGRVPRMVREPPPNMDVRLKVYPFFAQEDFLVVFQIANVGANEYSFFCIIKTFCSGIIYLEWSELNELF